jgi:hypothetical protein
MACFAATMLMSADPTVAVTSSGTFMPALRSSAATTMGVLADELERSFMLG